MDNLFTSPALFQELGTHGVGACGTLRVNRVSAPEVIKKKKLKKGDPLNTAREGNSLFLSWFDKRQVNVMTTIHNDITFRKQVRARGQQQPREVDKPRLPLKATLSTWGESTGQIRGCGTTSTSTKP